MSSTAVQIILGVALAFTAIGLSCAVWISLRRPPAADPFFHPFGDMPGFTDAQLSAIARAPHPRDPLRRGFTHEYFDSAGPAIPPDAGGGGGFLKSPRASCRRPQAFWRPRHG